jgi:hypothetical protein
MPKWRAASAATVAAAGYQNQKQRQLEDSSNEEKMFLVRTDLAMEFAAYAGRVTKETIEATRTAARAWQDLLSKQERT